MNTEDNINQDMVATEAPQSNTLDSKESKGFSQEEVNRIVADRISRERKKFDGIDVDQYKNWQTQEEERNVEQQKQRGEFDKIIKEQAEKFQNRIGDLETTLKREKVDGALLNSAASLKSVAPSQVADLLKNRVRLNEQGEAEVTLTGGQGSGMLTSMSLANCFVILAQAQGNTPNGTLVTVEPFNSVLC